MNTFRRNYGVDLLRIISMYMIVLNHSLSIGGVIAEATHIRNFNYQLSWFLDIICYCAVNCYALISGYVGVESQFKLRNLIRLWCQVLFYSVIINFIVAWFVPGVDLSYLDIISSFLPVSFERYWYFSAYFVMFLGIPAYNYLLNKLDKGILQNGIIILILIFSLGETFIFRVKNFLGLQSGYSVLWLVVLYIIGGYIRLYGWNLWKRDRLVFTGLALLSFIFFLAFGGEEGHGRVLVNYPAPTILFMGIALFNYFRQYIPGKTGVKYIKRLAPLTFGVYLIHLQPMVAEHILRNRFTFLASVAPLNLLLSISLISLVIYLICSMLEWLRQRVFIWLKIELLVDKLTYRVSEIICTSASRL